MDRYGSDTEGEDQERPLLHREHEGKIQRGEKEKKPKQKHIAKANNEGASV